MPFRLTAPGASAVSVLALALALCYPVVQASAATPAAPVSGAPAFSWDHATVYFLLTDRFNNANRANDLAYGRKLDAAPLRGYMGGDLAGVTAKIKAGYFKDLGVDALWISPPVEQIHGSTDEGTGVSYGFHGYWAGDFTSVDANLGTEADLHQLVDTAHAHGMRVLLDVVMNHTGPATKVDPEWPADWVRLDPVCTHKDTATTVDCALVKGLPDVRTESNKEVKLPQALVTKWKKEGRYTRELAELNEFFDRTGFPRAPRYFLIKWHADWVRKYGFDGFRGDTVKHTQPNVWKDLRNEASRAYEQWKQANPKKRVGDLPFYMTAEVFNYSIRNGRSFDMGAGKSVDFYDNGFDSLINFSLPADAKGSYEQQFSSYAAALAGPLKGYSVLSYMSSHDDSAPFDAARQHPFDTANRLLLSPGAVQIYYGDETARLLKYDGAVGDAALRSPMNWDELASNARRDGYRIADVRRHWSLLGQFRHSHPAIGAGVHHKLADAPYTFSRTLGDDHVVVALDVPAGRPVTINVGDAFDDGDTVTDRYSGKRAVVTDGKVRFTAQRGVLLIAE